MIRRNRARLDALLDEQVDDGTPVAGVIAALQPDPESQELPGLNAAMTAYYRLGPGSRAIPAPPVRRGRRRSGVLRSTVLKIGALIGSASVVGGVALAAHVGTIPSGPAKHAPGRVASTATQGPGRAAVTTNAARESGAHERGRTGSISPARISSTHAAGPVTASSTGARSVASSATPTGGPNGDRPSAPASTHPAHPSHPAHPTTGRHSPSPGKGEQTPPVGQRQPTTPPGRGHRSP